MSSDIFIKLDDIKGESQDDKHRGEIDVLSWSWGSTQPGMAQTGGGTGKGKIQVHDLTFAMPNSCATPTLLGLHFSGKPIKKGVLTMRKAGHTPLEYAKITMEDCIVTSVNHTGGGADPQTHSETVTLQFARVKYEYTPQNSDGSGGAAVTTGWDVAGNKAL
jgi:type VI secretion system secreted protein Hcp